MVTASELTVRKVSHTGACANGRSIRSGSGWTKVHEEFGIERLFLVSRGKQTADRGLSRPDEKASLRRGAFGSARRSEARADGPVENRASISQKSGGSGSCDQPR